LLYEVLENFPDYAKAHNHLGWIYHYKMTDYTKAERHYKLSLKFSKNYHSPYGNYAYFLIDKGDYKAMIDFGLKALKIDVVDKGTENEFYSSKLYRRNECIFTSCKRKDEFISKNKTYI